jgi:hypothetical protein
MESAVTEVLFILGHNTSQEIRTLLSYASVYKRAPPTPVNSSQAYSFYSQPPIITAITLLKPFTHPTRN